MYTSVRVCQEMARRRARTTTRTRPKSTRRPVWLDFTVDRRGKAATVARVPLSFRMGSQSVVVHEHRRTRAAPRGARLACIGVAF